MGLRALCPVFLVFVLLVGAGSLGAQEQEGPAATHVLLPSSGFQGGLITGVVLGDDDQPVANVPVNITGGVPAVLSGEVIGEEPPEDHCGRNPGPVGTPGERNPGPSGTNCAQQVTKQPGPPSTPAGEEPPGIRGGVLTPLAKPQDCATLLSQAAGIVGRNQGADHILIGLSQPATAGAEGPAVTNGAYLNAAGGGIRTDAQGRFAYCARSDAEQTQVALGDGSVRTAIALSADPDPSCRKTSEFFMPNSTVDVCQPAMKGVVLQGGHTWRLPAARAFSSGGDRAITTFKMPRDLGPGRALLVFSDGHGAPQSFIGGVFQVVRASLDVNKLRSHQATDFDYEIALTGFGPASGQNQFGPEYGRNLCVRVTTQGPIELAQAPESRLAVNGDGHALVRGQIRATQVAPGSAVPFGIRLHVANCSNNLHAGADLPRLMSFLQPSARAWFEQRARTAPLDQNALSNLVTQRFGGLDLSSESVDDAVTLLMMLASQDAQQDLRDQLAAMDKANKQKQKMRDAISALKAARNAAGSKQPKALCSPDCDLAVRNGAALLPVSSRQWTGPITLAKLDQLIDQLEAQKDSLDQLTEQLQLQLQMFMDRRSQFEEMLSNVMKANSDTEQSILSGLK